MLQQDWDAGWGVVFSVAEGAAGGEVVSTGEGEAVRVGFGR